MRLLKFLVVLFSRNTYGNIEVVNETKPGQINAEEVARMYGKKVVGQPRTTFEEAKAKEEAEIAKTTPVVETSVKAAEPIVPAPVTPIVAPVVEPVTSKEVTIEAVNKEKAVEITKDLPDTALIEVDGEQVTKADWLKSLEKPAEPTEIKVGEKVYSPDEYKVEVDKMFKNTGTSDEERAKLSPESVKIQLAMYQKMSKSTNDKSQELAQERRAILEEKSQLEKTKTNIESELSEARRLKEEAKKALLTDEAITALPTYTEQSMALTKRELAKEKILSYDNYEQRLSKQLITISDAASKDAFKLAYNVVRETIPEFSYDEHPLLVLKHYDDGIEKDIEKITKANMITQFVNDVMQASVTQKSDKQLTEFIPEFFKINKWKYGLTNTPTAQPVKENIVKPETKDTQPLLKIKTAQDNNPKNINDSSAGTDAQTEQFVPGIKRDREGFLQKLGIGKKAYPSWGK